MESLLITLGIIVIAAAVFAVVARRLRQPLLLGYVIAGFLIGPAILGIISDPEPIELLSELGLIFLMFVIGLELDISKLKDMGRVSALLGFLQVAFTTLAGMGLAIALGFTWIQGLYLGFVLAFSSTIVVVKALTEKNELSSLYGELVLGVLVIQDILAVLALTLLGTLKGSDAAVAFPTLDQLLATAGILLPAHPLATFASILVQGVLFAGVAYLFFRFLMPLAFGEHVPHELLFVASLAVVFLMSALAGFFHFSFAIGAFAAGIALSSAPYSHEVVGRVRPLKDFFLILFFVSLGMRVAFDGFVSQWVLVVYLILGAFILKPVVTFLAMKLLRYHTRTAFLVSLHLAQLSEFGLVLVTSGILAGFLTQSMLAATVVVTIISMTGAVYAIKYDDALYRLIRPLLQPSDLLFGSRPEEVRNVPEKFRPEVLVIGSDPTVEELLLADHTTRKVLLVDENPRTAVAHRARGIPTVCSDAANADLYETIDLSRVKLVVSVIRESEEFLQGTHSNLYLIRKIREVAPSAAIIVHASTESFGLRLYAAGATVVLTPALVGRRMLAALCDGRKTAAQLRELGAAYRGELQHIELGLTRAA